MKDTYHYQNGGAKKRLKLKNPKAPCIVFHVKALKHLLCQIKLLKIFLIRSFSYRQSIWHKMSILLSLSRGKYFLIRLENCRNKLLH